ncbi:winged helix-turn-helix transcriptional regulator [Chlorogloeopsis fritschii]|uniref:winged helix-turn-helix transcriptional regulator n=1 Tax=Chlorogloeopsis fritschii TaxID=1124 RepID=UPI0003037931|nr:winged helix-turn-helix transcriptional regulator [Chlorogloeopsis fritschii]
MISRKIYPEIPPKVEYSLTDLGKQLEPTLLSLESWGIKYVETMKYSKNIPSEKID